MSAKDRRQTGRARKTATPKTKRPRSAGEKSKSKVKPARPGKKRSVPKVESSRPPRKRAKPKAMTARRSRVSDRFSHYRTLFEHAGDGVYLQTLDGKILDINRSGARMLGYTPKELIGGYIADIVTPEIAGRLAKIAEDLRREKSLTVEGENIRKDGGVFPVEVSLSLVQESEGELVIAIVRDISERKEIEQARQESEARFRTVVENAPDFMYVLDRGGAIRFVNRTAPGFRPEEVVGRSFLDYLPEESHAMAEACLKTVFAEGRSAGYDTSGPGSDSSTAWYATRIAPVKRGDEVIAAIIIARNITERKRMEEALRESEETAKALLNAPTDSVFLIDRDATLLAVNTTAAERLGRSPDELVGRNGRDVFPPDVFEPRMARALEVFKTGRPLRFEDERAGVCFDNVFYPVLDSRGEVTRVAAVARDITARKRAEQALTKSEERFRDVFENSMIGMYRTSPDGRILMANSTLAAMLGYSSMDELLERNLEEHGYEPGYERADFKELIEGDGKIRGWESAWRKKDGGTLFVRESAREVRDEVGNTLYYEGTVEDITDRKRAEQELQQSEERYRILMESIRDGVYTLDTEGCFTYVNDEIVRRSGQSEEWFLSRTYLDVVRPEDHEKAREQFKRAMRGERVPAYDLAYATVTGEDLWVEVNSTPLRQGGEVVGLMGVSRDITARKRAEQALRESEEKYRVLAEKSLQGIVIAQGDPPRFVYVNPAVADVLDCTVDELMSMGPAEIIALSHPDDKHVFEYYRARTQGEAAPNSHEFRIIRKDGSIRWLEARTSRIEYGGDIAAQGTFVDITGRKRAEEMDETLRVVSTRFIHPENLDETISDTLRDVGCLLDVDCVCLRRLSEDGRILDVSHQWWKADRRSRPCFVDLAEYSWLSDRLLGNETVTIDDTGALDSAQPSFWRNQGAKAIVAIPVFIGDALEGMLSVGVISGARSWEPGEVRFLRSVSESMARAMERAAAEAERARLQKQILRGQKMRAIANMAGGIAQDSRDALFTILASITLLRQQLGDREERFPSLDRINQSAQSISQLVDRLYSFGRQLFPDPERVRPNECLERAIEGISHILKDNVRIVRASSPDLWTVQANPDRLERVFAHILINAVEAIEGSGEIRIRTENVAQVPFSGTIESGARLGQSVHVHISDTGIGMSSDTLAGIFEPFVSNKFVGRGLGMAEAYGIIRQYKGVIFVDSEPGRGTNVHLYLPADRAIELVED